MVQEYSWPNGPRVEAPVAPIASITPMPRPNAAVTPAAAPIQPLPGAGMAVADAFLSPVRPPEAAPLASNNAVEWNGVAPPTPIYRPKRAAILHTMPRLGVLDALLADDEVHDILVNGTSPIYTDRGGELEDSGLRFATDEEVWKVAETILASVGQRWDANCPMFDTRLPDGSRVNIIAPPMALDGVNISIRKFPKMHITLDGMVERMQLTPEVADFLKRIVGARLNVVISGGTGSGKTTLMNALSAGISSNERIVTIEDAAELRLQQPHVVRLESTASSLAVATATEVSVRDLVRNALRMRPDRIIVGEVRGSEAFDVMQAMNTGHEGSMTTLHANSTRDAMSRMETMVALAMSQLPIRVVRGQIANTLNIIIQTNRTRGGVRRITHVSEVAGMEGETVIMQDLIVLREDEKTGHSEYRWVAGSSRNAVITQAAQQSGLMRGFR